MFLTYPHFEQAMPSGLAHQGSRYWRAVEISMRMPWIMLTLIEEGRDGAFERTVLLSNAADLVSVIGTHRASSFRGLHVVSHAALAGEGVGWESRPVRRVWRDSGDCEGQHGLLIFEDGAGRTLDEFGVEASDPSGVRTLLLELPASLHAHSAAA